MGKRLKNFDAYMSKLKHYARAVKLRVEYRDEPGDGAYVPSRRKIILDRDLEEADEVSTFLHELGHSIDFSLYPKTTDKMLSRAYDAYYSDKATRRQKVLVIHCERQAWFYARSLAKRLRIRLGVWFDKAERDALKTYRKGG